jgi:hypothetical protein
MDPELVGNLPDYGNVLWVASTDRNMDAKQLGEILARSAGGNVLIGNDDYEWMYERFTGPDAVVGDYVVILLDEFGFPVAVLEVSRPLPIDPEQFGTIEDNDFDPGTTE